MTDRRVNRGRHSAHLTDCLLAGNLRPRLPTDFLKSFQTRKNRSRETIVYLAARLELMFRVLCHTVHRNLYRLLTNTISSSTIFSLKMDFSNPANRKRGKFCYFCYFEKYFRKIIYCIYQYIYEFYVTVPMTVKNCR